MIDSKVYELMIYDEIINNLFYENRQRKANNEEFWNLDKYQTQTYKTLSLNKKVIRYK